MERVRIRFDREGNWFFNELPVTNKNIQSFLTRHLSTNGRKEYLLRVGEDVYPVEVEDTPALVTHCQVLKTIPVLLRVVLNDRTEEVIPWQWIWAHKDCHLYCFVKGQRFKARFNRNSQFELGRVLDFDEERGRFFLATAGWKCYLAQEGTGGFSELQAETMTEGFDGCTHN